MLFALVLVVAALAASFSRTSDSGDPLTPPNPNAERTQTDTQPDTDSDGTLGHPGQRTGLDRRAARHARVRRREDQTRRLATGAAASVEVSVDEPGQVSLPLLGSDRIGRAAHAGPLRRPGHRRGGNYPVVFTPAQGDEEREVGTLTVTAQSE